MRAADEVSRYRSRFPTLREWADELGRTAKGHFWREFDAGAAYGLLGQTDEAHRWLARVYEPRDDARDWVLAAQARAQELDALLADGEQFRSQIAETVRRFRMALKLDPDVELTFD
jgi:hypothetical protein